MEKIGYLSAASLYPVKGMRGHDIPEAIVTPHGIYGDRGYAFVDETEKNQDFPWMTGRKGSQMLLFVPYHSGGPGRPGYRIRVKTPEGTEYAIDDPEFERLLEERFERPLRLASSPSGLYDQGSISMIGMQTIRQLGLETGITLDRRRFRANLYVEWDCSQPFYEDTLVGRTLQIGDDVQMGVAEKNRRCRMISMDPETGTENKAILAHVLKHLGGCAGVYADVVLGGMVKPGDDVFLM